MEVQVLDAFPIQSQPRLDVGVFGITRGGVRVSLLDFPSALLIDLRHHRPERHPKNRSLGPAPAAPVHQRLGKFENLTRKLHSLSVRIRIVGQPLRLPTAAMAGGAPALQIFDNFANQSRPAINESGIKLNKLRASLKLDRKSTRLNSSHLGISYAVFC